MRTVTMSVWPLVIAFTHVFALVFVRKIVRKPPLELGVAVPVTPGSTPCPEGFVVQLPSQQDVVQQTERADRCAELFVGFGFKADALKAGAEMGDKVLSIVRIQAQLKLTMRPMTVPSCS